MGEQLTLFSADFHANNPSPWLVSRPDGTTIDTCGLNFRGWSLKLDRIGSLLKTYLGSCPLPLMTFARTWSVSATPSGFGILKLRLSERRTAERESSLWHTPLADDATHGQASTARILRKMEKHQMIRLQDQVNYPTLFRTPDAGYARGGQSKERRLLALNDQRSPDGVQKELSRRHGLDLPTHIQIFPTPTAYGNYNRKGASAKSGDGLATIARLYPTPTCNDAKNNNPPSQRTENGRHSNQLNVVAGGALNPAWVEWLMGFPPGWTEIGGESSPTSPALPKAFRIVPGG